MNRWRFAVGVVLLAVSFGVAQQQPKSVTRLGLESDYEVYPQSTPKELMASVAKAVNRERYDYLAAHLMEPDFIDARLQRANLKLEDLGKEIKSKFQAQPEVLKDLLKILNGGEVVDSGTTVVVKHKDVKGQQVYLKKVGDLWYVENRQKDEKKE